MGLDVLLSTLADDQPTIARKITKLLLPSYFPSKVMDDEACKRCRTLFKRSATAGARFCEFAASEGASLRSLMKLFKNLIGFALSSVKLDDELIEGLLVAASHLCMNLAKDASFQGALKEELSAEKLKTLFAVASTARAQSSICHIISVTSLDAVGDLFEDCMGLITNCTGLSDNIEMQAQARTVHKIFLLRGWFDDMFETLVGLLKRAACACNEKFGIELGRLSTRMKTKSATRSLKAKHSNGKKSSNSQKNRHLEDYAIAVGVAWQMKDILLSENTRTAMLDSGTLESAYLALKVISEASIVHCLHYDYLKTYPVSTYTTLTLHMALHNIKTDGSMDSMQASDIPIYCHLNEILSNVFQHEYFVIFLFHLLYSLAP